jgi:hypothetical protein
LQTLEQQRKDVADLRSIWSARHQPFMAKHLKRLAFIDEISVKTNMAKTTGRAPRGQRLVDHAPFGHRRAQTFIGALRHDRIDAPSMISGAMNREMVDLYVKTQLIPRRNEFDSLRQVRPPPRLPAQPPILPIG